MNVQNFHPFLFPGKRWWEFLTRSRIFLWLPLVEASSHVSLAPQVALLSWFPEHFHFISGVFLGHNGGQKSNFLDSVGVTLVPIMEQEKNWSYQLINLRAGHLEIMSDDITSCRKCSESHIPVLVSMPLFKLRTACPCTVQTPGLFLGTDKAVKFQCPGENLGQCLGVHKALSTPRVMGWREWSKVPCPHTDTTQPNTSVPP